MGQALRLFGIYVAILRAASQLAASAAPFTLMSQSANNPKPEIGDGCGAVIRQGVFHNYKLVIWLILKCQSLVSDDQTW